MSSGHKTSAIARPRRDQTRRDQTRRDQARRDQARRDQARRERSDSTVFGDLTRPIRADRQLVTGRRHRWVMGVLALAILGALLGALFVLPIQEWQLQDDQEQAKREELAVLAGAARELDAEVDHLRTPEGSKEAAREELGVIAPGEERISILPSTAAPLPLPTGWPYDTVSRIVAVLTVPGNQPIAPVASTMPPAVSATP
jgi:cell division protein FtsB